jgi:hypothetical protein
MTTKSTRKKGKWLVSAAAFLLMMLYMLNPMCFAQHRYEFTPSISVSGDYDDNLFLTPDNEVDDYITTVTPSLALRVRTQNTDMSARYAPSFVRYSDRDDLDTTRHLGNVTWGQQLSEHLKFDLTDTYINSDDPLEDEFDVEGIRRTRNKYQVNVGRASVGYEFGAESKLSMGYGREDRENDETTLDDSVVQTPFGSLTYWFNVKNGIELTYTYTDVDYSRDNAAPVNDDYTGHEPGLRYIRRFSPHSRGYVGYSYATREFDGITEDYVVHNGYVGVEHSFSPQYSISARGGYFVQANDISENQDGPTYSVSLTRTFARGSIVIGGDGGWYEEYLVRDVRAASGFTKYYGGYARLTYQVLEPVNFFAGGSYRHDKDEFDLSSDFVRANGGFTFSFMRWFSLTLSYTFADRNDDVESDSYTDNRVTATLTAAKPFRW